MKEKIAQLVQTGKDALGNPKKMIYNVDTHDVMKVRAFCRDMADAIPEGD